MNVQQKFKSCSFVEGFFSLFPLQVIKSHLNAPQRKIANIYEPPLFSDTNHFIVL